MFKIKKDKFGDFTKLKIINSKTKEYVAIIPELGANVDELVLSKKGKNYPIIDGAKGYGKLITKTNGWFRGSKLLPFPNRINNGEYCFYGKKYRLPINFPAEKHAIHGLIYNKKFKVKKKSVNRWSASVDLEYNYKKEVRGYPFNFKVIITYTLTKDGFMCKTLIKNIGKEKMPVGDGWHPYFKIKGKVDNFLLKIPSVKKINVNNRMIPNGTITSFNKFASFSKIGKHRFDTGFVLRKKEGIATTELYDPLQKLKLIVWQETGKMKYNYLQIFIPPNRKSIAIEPMTCNTNAFNNKEGLIILKPNQMFKAGYGVCVEK